MHPPCDGDGQLVSFMLQQFYFCYSARAISSVETAYSVHTKVIYLNFIQNVTGMMKACKECPFLLQFLCQSKIHKNRQSRRAFLMESYKEFVCWEVEIIGSLFLWLPSQLHCTAIFLLQFLQALRHSCLHQACVQCER